MTDFATHLHSLGIELPDLPAPAYSYVPFSRHGDTLYLSGQISRNAAGDILEGRVGEDASIEDGIYAAEVATINLLARIQQAIGLDNVAQILKLNVWVNSTDEFIQQPLVADGASQLLEKVFGEAGKHARTALPTHTLPQGALVELDAVVAIK
ncbi:YjgF translation initiation inhibitor [Corynebacterium suranareeae]|uniref:YjgF translation initiation inhibitor n=1 Tax=Corynebacterium suranareeae TaxID=2506452 RepID=A0A169RQ42_9CORY|nr:RidA family protein [Corynebacterium suranareeae]BAU94848.1 YjgF translation initiation inhibitor [Corynebacterium suranareeae]